MRVRRGLRGLRDAALILLVAASGLQAQVACGPQDRELRLLSFEGNRAFTDRELAASIVTTAPSWTRYTIGVGERRCINPEELRNDVLRIRVLYRDRGYPAATVDTVVTSAIREAVDLTFRITEGPPILVDSFVVTGVDSLTQDDRNAVLGNLGIDSGAVFDRVALQAAVDSIRVRLWNRGYPQADVAREFTVSDSTRTAYVGLLVIPGSRSRLAEVRVAGEPSPGREQEIPDAVVRRIAGLRPGQLYREDDLAAAQRRLYQTDAFRSVEVRAAPDSMPGTDTLMAVTVRVREDLMRQVDAEVGWATLDCFRTRAVYTNRNFLRGARRLEVTGQLSKIGIGEPLDFASGLCNDQLDRDPFSSQVNYFVGATLRQPNLLGTAFTPQVSIYSERRGEYLAYLRRTLVGGELAATSQLRRDVPLRLGYSLEYGRTDAQPALLCAVFSRCDDESRQRIGTDQLLAVASAGAARVKVDNLMLPTFGSAVRGEYRIAHRLLGSAADLQFQRGSIDASLIRPVPGGAGSVRLRLGAVYPLGGSGDSTEAFIPPQERLYAGGATSVRGFQQNELGAVGYIAQAVPADTLIGGRTFYYLQDSTIQRVVPFGGNSLVVANFEYRIPNPLAPRLVQHVFFADAGAVWNRGDEGSAFNLRWTPGTSLRVITPVGPVQINLAYNPYTRPAGPVYYDFPLDQAGGGGQLVCVYPVGALPTAAQAPTVDADACPAAYRPTRSRFTLTFSIGPEF